MSKSVLNTIQALTMIVITVGFSYLVYTFINTISEDRKIASEKLNKSFCQQVSVSLGGYDYNKPGYLVFVCKEK